MRTRMIQATLIVLVLLGGVIAYYFNQGTSPGSRASTSLPSISYSSTGPFATDCYSEGQPLPGSNQAICADPAAGTNAWNGRFYDNGLYIGHDEPSVQFFSNTPGSGYNLEWAVTLPTADPIPTQNGSAVANMELYRSIWFSMALCDPWSYPGNPCTPDSDSNIGGPWPATPNAAGSAGLEFQIYPPYSGFCNPQSAKWCARTSISSLETTYNYATVNTKCNSPVNTAYIQTDGVLTGPPGPGSPVPSPNSNTLFMNAGDHLLVIIKDTPAGLYTGINDTTTRQSGYMVASAANGFAHTNMTTCATAPFSFHPEFNTASLTHVSSWTEQAYNINLAFEIGHWELGTHGDNDKDDGGCGQLWAVSGCLADGSGGTDLDTDFDSVAYGASWPDGSANRPATLIIGSPSGNGVGPLSYVDGSGYVAPYSTMLFSTQVNDANPNCNTLTEAGCSIPPDGATFYPFYSLAGSGSSCVMNFGNDIGSTTTNDFGKDRQYGTPTGGVFWGAKMANPCLPSTSFTTTTTTTSSVTTTSTAATSLTSATTSTTTTATSTPSVTTLVTTSSSTAPSTATTTTTSVTSSSTASLTASTASSIASSTITASTSTPASTATSTSASSSTTSTSAGGGGIPEFPYQLLAVTVFTALIIASYFATKLRNGVRHRA